MILTLLLAALGATSYSLSKVLLSIAPPLFLTSVRLIVSGIVFYGYFRMSEATSEKLRFSDYCMLSMIACLGYGLPFALEFWALKFLPSSMGAFFFSLSPIISSVFAYAIFHEITTLKKLLGFSTAFFALVPALSLGSYHHECYMFSCIPLPELCLFFSVVLFALNCVMIRKAVRRRKIPISFVSSYGMIFGGLFSLVLSLAFEIILYHNTLWCARYIPIIDVSSFLFYGILLILVGNTAYYGLQMVLLKYYSTTLVSFAELASPIFAMFYGCILLGEPIEWYFIPSVLLLLVGTYIFFREERRQGYIKKSVSLSMLLNYLF